MHRTLTLLLLAGCATDVDLSATEQEVAGGTLAVAPAWVVQIANGCSATILDERWVMTAAHCITGGETINSVTVVNGAGGHISGFSGLVRSFTNPDHPGPSNAVHDVGLIYLESGALDLAALASAKLYADAREPWNDDSEPNAMSIAGWGANNDDCGDNDGTGDGVLRLGTGLHVDLNGLNVHYASAGIGSVHACGGDSGAPYMLFRGTSPDADFLQFAVHSGRRYTSIPELQIPTIRHQGALLTDNIGWIESTIAASTSTVFSTSWQDGYHGGYHYRRNVLATRPFGDVQGFGSRCMQAVGSAVEMRTCDGSQSQRWRFELSGEIILQSSQRGGRCLTLSNLANRTQLTLTTCNAGTTQRFWYDDTGHLYTARDLARTKCIEAGGNFDGAHVQVFDCNGTAPQMWLP